MRKSGCGVVVLAGGSGEIDGQPKTLLKIDNLSMLQRLVVTLQTLSWPIAVVINGTDAIRDRLQEDLHGIPNLHFVLQPWRLGTADAFSRGASLLLELGYPEAVTVHADHPAWSQDTIHRLAAAHKQNRSVMTVGVVRSHKLPDPWPLCFQNFGRIYRKDGRIVNIVEARHVKDGLPPSEHFELNTALYCLNLDWALTAMWRLTPKQNGNSPGPPEFYLPELLLVAADSDNVVHLEPVPWWEALAVNTKEELQQLTERGEWL